MIKKFSNYFKVGDVVIVKKGHRRQNLVDKIGVIKTINTHDGVNYYLVSLVNFLLPDYRVIEYFCGNIWFVEDEIKLFNLNKEIESKIKKEEVKLKHMDIDPYGEEDWIDQDYNSMHYLNEGKIEDFQIGDTVICNGQMDDIYFKGEIGIIISLRHFNASVKFPERFDNHLWNCNGIDITNSSYYIDYHLLELADPEKIEYRKKIREERRLKHMDIDPYGEEDWLSESVNENSNHKFNIGDRVVVNDKLKNHVVKNRWDRNMLDCIGRSYTIRKRDNNYYFLNESSYYFPEDCLDLLDPKEQKRKEERLKQLRLKHMDIDPYGEEDWLNENFENDYDFKNGDKVICTGNQSGLDLNGQIGTIIDKHSNNTSSTVNGVVIKGIHYDVKFHSIGYTYIVSKNILKPISELRKKREEMRLKYMDIDPYGEEDWDMDYNSNYYKHLNESEINDFQIGDSVICHGQMDDIYFNGEVGIILSMSDSPLLAVKFPERFNNHLWDCDRIDFTNSSYYIYYYLLELTDPEKIEYRKKIREEMRLKHMDVDPYGEETWEDDDSLLIRENRIYENKDYFNVGDVVVCNGRMDNILFKGEIGIITRINDDVSACVKFDNRFNVQLHTGYGDHTRSSYNISFDHLKKADGDEFEKWEEEQKRIKQKKEEYRLKHMDIDPYGEENWEI